MSFLKSESYSRGAFTSIFFSGIAKGLAFFQSVVIAFYFGSNFQTDVYFFVYTTITLIASYIISLNYLVLIPEAMKLAFEVSEIESQRFLNFFLYGFIFLVSLLELCFYSNPIQFFDIFSKLDSNILESEKHTMMLFMPVLLLIVLTTYFTDILTSKKYFALPLVVNSINSLLTVVSVFVFHKYLGVGGAIIGIYVGYIINILWLLYIFFKKLNWNFFSVNYKIQKKVRKNIAYAYLSQITTFLGSFFPIYLISSFSSGVMTSLNYAQRLNQIPEQLIISQTSSVLGVKLNELSVNKQNNELNRILLEVISSTLFLTVPCSFAFFLYSERIVEIIYMRGSFGLSAVKSTALFLKYLGLSIPFIALNAFYSRVFIALQKMKLAFYSTLIVNILFLFLIYLFVQLYGPVGYPIAIATYLSCSVVILFPLLFNLRIPLINSKEIIKCVCKVYGLNIMLNLPVWILMKNEICLSIGLYIIWILSCLMVVNYYTMTSIHFYILQKRIMNRLFYLK